MMREELIDFVLEQFQAMGATKRDLKKERYKLENDPVYFKEWCIDLHAWCDRIFDSD